MPVGDRWWQQDLLLRALGLGSWLIALLAIRHLVGLAHAGPRPEVTSGEIGLAAVGFLGFSFGSVLALLGTRITDQVAIADRWRTRLADQHVVDRLSSEGLLARFEQQPSDLSPVRRPKISVARDAHHAFRR